MLNLINNNNKEQNKQQKNEDDKKIIQDIEEKRKQQAEENLLKISENKIERTKRIQILSEKKNTRNKWKKRRRIK